MSRAPLLIVNADDLGMSAGINRAIFEGHDRGIVTSASLMAVGAAFEGAVAGLAARPRLGCGVHLVLHDERPVLPPSRIPGLVEPGGRFLPLDRVLRRLLAGSLPRAEVEAELAAQIERALAAGVRLTHLDSHCHLHAFPMLGSIVHGLGRRCAVPCARRAEIGFLGELRGAPLGRVPLALLISACQRFTRWRVRDGLRTPDRMLGLLRSGSIDAEWLVRAIAALPAGRVTELMVHPGDGTDGPSGEDHGSLARRRELDAVTSPSVAEAVRRAGVELVSYRHIAA
jgi:chitin disaccharide deacetylase